jgi:hypothetical protein
LYLSSTLLIKKTMKAEHQNFLEKLEKLNGRFEQEYVAYHVSPTKGVMKYSEETELDLDDLTYMVLGGDWPRENFNVVTTKSIEDIRKAYVKKLMVVDGAIYIVGEPSYKMGSVDELYDEYKKSPFKNKFLIITGGAIHRNALLEGLNRMFDENMILGAVDVYATNATLQRLASNFNVLVENCRFGVMFNSILKHSGLTIENSTFEGGTFIFGSTVGDTPYTFIKNSVFSNTQFHVFEEDRFSTNAMKQFKKNNQFVDCKLIKYKSGTINLTT